MSTIFVKTIDGKLVVINDFNTNKDLKCIALYVRIAFITDQAVNVCIPLYFGKTFIDPTKKMSEYKISNSDTLYARIYSTHIFKPEEIIQINKMKCLLTNK